MYYVSVNIWTKALVVNHTTLTLRPLWFFWSLFTLTIWFWGLTTSHAFFSERRLSQYIIGTNMVTHVPCSVSVGTPIMKRAWDKVYLALNTYLKFYTSHRWLCRRLRKRWVHVLHSLRKNVAFNWYWVLNVSYLGCRRKWFCRRLRRLWVRWTKVKVGDIWHTFDGDGVTGAFVGF